MEIKVRALDGIEAKSTQEIEKELLDKHEESIASEGQVKSEDVKSEDEDSIQEGDVLSFINKR